MDFGRLPLFQAMAKKMAWLGERQHVLAQNIANLDTPGFVPQDLKKPDFRALVADASMRLPLSGTQANHLASLRAGAGSMPRVDAAKGSERMPSGNAVSLEGEMMKVSETASDYAIMTNLYRRHLSMVRAALGRGQG
jgi:flagellar basal-body rod protein FlgB